MTALFTLLFLGMSPLDSEFPLASPERGSIDPRLLGVWFAAEPEESDDRSYFEFARFNGTEYLVNLVGVEKGKTTVMRFRAYLVRLGDRKVLQANPLGNEKQFYLAAFSFSDAGELSLRLVEETRIPAEIKGDREKLVVFLATRLDETLEDPAIEWRLVRRKKPAGS